MTKRLITVEEAKKLIPGNLIPTAHTGNKTEWLSLEVWRAQQLEKFNNNYLLVPLFIVDERYLCCIDVGYGHDVVFDLKDKEYTMSNIGIFNHDWCFLSDYYGYSEGAFFYKVV